MKADLQGKIVAWLKEHGVTAKVSGSQVAVNRESILHSEFAGIGTLEMTTYHVLSAIENQFFYPLGYMWDSRTDDDLFLDTLDGN
jgi:hypothetical protein